MQRICLFVLNEAKRIKPREIFRKENLLLAVRAVGRSMPKSSGELRVQIPVKNKAQCASLFCCTSFTAYLYMT
jgi:hypothetical protein